MAGVGMKPEDNLTVPLCVFCHMRQHNEGEKSFWGDRLDEAKCLAHRLFACTGDRQTALEEIAGWKK